jgi:hypothetical protein
MRLSYLCILLLAASLHLASAPNASAETDAAKDAQAQREPTPTSIHELVTPLEQLIHAEARFDALTREQRDEVLSSHGLKTVPDSSLAWRTIFLRNSRKPGQLVYYNPQKGLLLFQRRQLVAQEKPIQIADAQTLKQLNLSAAILPVQIVQDGTTQLLTWHIKPQEDKSERLILTLYKPIGSSFGKPFEQPIATRPDKNSPWELLATFELLKGKKHYAIKWTTLPHDLHDEPPQTKLLLWNRWEGAFREPTAPHTRPRRDNAGI